MFTKEQLEGWKAKGFSMPPEYENFAVSTEKKLLSINFISVEEDASNMKIKFRIVSQGLKNLKVNIFIEKTTTALGFIGMTETLASGSFIISQNKIDISMAIESSRLAFSESEPLIYSAIAISGDLSSQSRNFNLSLSHIKVDKPEICFCKKEEFTVSDIQYIVSQLRKREDKHKEQQFDKGNKIFIDNGKIVHANDRGLAPTKTAQPYLAEKSLYDAVASDGKQVADRLFFFRANELNIRESERNYFDFTKQLNHAFKKYNITNCLRRIHFLAQIYTESTQLRSTYEANPSSKVSGGDYYRGRGLKQLTHDYNYLEYYDFVKNTKYFSIYLSKRLGYEGVLKFNERTLNKYISIEEMDKINKFIKLISIDTFYAVDSAGHYWNKNEINKYADLDDVEKVSAMVNNPNALKDKVPQDSINGYDNRKLNTNWLKEIFDYAKCK